MDVLGQGEARSGKARGRKAKGRHMSEFDFNAIRRGDVIERREMERILATDGGPVTSDADYNFRVHLWVQNAQRKLRKLGKPMTLRTEKGDVYVLNDADASEHNTRMFGVALRKARRRHRMLLDVDRRRLSAEERLEHERAVTTQAAILQGMSVGRRSVAPEPHRRTTPVMR